MISRGKFVGLLASTSVAASLLLPQLGLAQEPQPPRNLFEVEEPTLDLPKLTPSAEGNAVHILPTVDAAGKKNALAALALGAPVTALIYHAGGPVMTTVTSYAIFWSPAKLQNGTALPPMSKSYHDLMVRFLTDYPGHGIANNNTQYYQTVGGVTTYIQSTGSFGGAVFDTDPFPASGCKDTATPGNCITDAQIQAEIAKVVAANKWKTGLNTIVFLFTAKGEGSCFDASSASCAYVQYCAYHGFIKGATPIIYANIPYGNTTVCQVAGTPSPNGDPEADTALTASSHELTEAITDPMLNAWFTAGGEEIGDLCNITYGQNTWDGNKANQMWTGHFYEVQMEYSNHTNLPAASGGCVQVGP